MAVRKMLSLKKTIDFTSRAEALVVVLIYWCYVSVHITVYAELS